MIFLHVTVNSNLLDLFDSVWSSGLPEWHKNEGQPWVICYLPWQINTVVEQMITWSFHLIYSVFTMKFQCDVVTKEMHTLVKI